MYNALELRNAKEKLNINFLESSLGFELPYKYKLFIETFRVGDGKVRYERFLNPANNKIIPCMSVQFLPFKGGRELFFNGIFSIEELVNDWKNYSSSSTEWQNNSMLRIGDIGVGGGLFLGVRDSMREKIYRIVWDWDEDYEFVANDIWEYYKGLGIDEDFSNMQDYKYSQLYKNWGEEFWRVREDGKNQT